MDWETFKTKKEAEAEIARMRGWTAKAVKMNHVNNDNNMTVVWVIQCDGDKYLREDGYVR